MHEIINILYSVDRKLFARGYDSDHDVVIELRKAIDELTALNEKAVKDAQCSCPDPAHGWFISDCPFHGKDQVHPQ